jgi:hypothetical protein
MALIQPNYHDVKSFDKITKRLQSAFPKYDLPTPLDENINVILFDFFDSKDFEIAHDMLNQIEEHEWFLISIANFSDMQRNLDPIFLSHSEADALGYVLECIDQYYIPISDIQTINDETVLSSNGKPIFKIRKQSIEDIKDSKINRYHNAVKGIRQYADVSRLNHKLGSLPGFAKYNIQASVHRNNDTRKPYGSVINQTPGNWAALFKTAVLSSTGISIKLSQAQELVAIMFGFKNWHHLNSKAQSFIYQDKVHSITFINNGEYSFEHTTLYKDIPEAIYALNNELVNESIPLDISLEASNISGLFITESSDKRHDQSVELSQLSKTITSDIYYQNALNSLEKCHDFKKAFLDINTLNLSKEEIIKVAHSRNETTTGDYLNLNGWMFYITKQSDMGILQGEVLNPGKDEKVSISATIHKSDICPIDGVMHLITEYGHQNVMSLNNFSNFDIIRLSQFTGIRVSDHNIYFEQ